MTINEALAIYAYLQHVPPGKRDEKIFSEAWGIICQYAEPAIRARSK